MKTLLKLLLFVILFALPFGGRWLWHQRGRYTPPEIAEIDASQIELPAMEFNAYEDQPKAGAGRVVIDLGHNNNLLIDDLTPLRDRLAARGATVETWDGYDELLDAVLYGATAYMVIAPAYTFSLDEIQAVKDFVADGGRVLIAADPTRPVPAYDDEYSDLYSIFFPESAIPAANSLANAFGVIYYEDYLYNLKSYESNYRNVRLTTFAKNNPLTQGLNSVVFFAAHSIKSDDVALLTADEETLSNIRMGETGLSPAVLAADGQVLALGDMTFLTTPYHQVADNDHFTSNIADWLAVDGRQWDLTDFPYLFGATVDVIQTLDDAITPAVIEYTAPLNDLFEQAGITVALVEEADPQHDAIILATFDQTDAVKDYLKKAGVTLTVTVKTEEGEETAKNGDQEETKETDEEKAEEGQAAEETPPQDLIAIAGVGDFTLSGMSLFIVDEEDGRTVLVILAEDKLSLTGPLDRLAFADFTSCITHLGATLCSSGDTSDWDSDGGGIDSGGGSDEGDESGGGDSGVDNVLVISADDGAGGTGTGAQEFCDAILGLYECTIWSTSADGYPTADDLSDYAAYVLAFGDYPFADDDLDKFDLFEAVGDNPVLVIGDQPLPPTFLVTEPAPINDLTVSDDLHPVAFGYMKGDTITLLAAQSDTPAIVFSAEDFANDENATAVFVRGETSPEAGSPAIVASEESSGQRSIIAAFAFQRLPEDERFALAWNMIYWLLNP
jgi:hypothetical protein